MPAAEVMTKVRLMILYLKRNRKMATRIVAILIALGLVGFICYTNYQVDHPIDEPPIDQTPKFIDPNAEGVEPDSPPALAEAIREVLDDPARAESSGAAARARCITDYSWDAMEQTLVDIFERLVSRRTNVSKD